MTPQFCYYVPSENQGAGPVKLYLSVLMIALTLVAAPSATSTAGPTDYQKKMLSDCLDLEIGAACNRAGMMYRHGIDAVYKKKVTYYIDKKVARKAYAKGCQLDVIKSCRTQLDMLKKKEGGWSSPVVTQKLYNKLCEVRFPPNEEIIDSRVMGSICNARGEALLADSDKENDFQKQSQLREKAYIAFQKSCRSKAASCFAFASLDFDMYHGDGQRFIQSAEHLLHFYLQICADVSAAHCAGQLQNLGRFLMLKSSNRSRYYTRGTGDHPGVALKAYAHACNKGHQAGCYRMAEMVRDGFKGQEPNKGMAKTMFQELCDKGLQPACEESSRL